MRSLDSLLDEAKWGTLTDDEIHYVVEKIKSSQVEDGDDEDLYTLIHILGRADCVVAPKNIYSPARGTKYRTLVESFLYYPSNTCITEIALKTLCTYWGYTADYLEEIKSFIKGVEWDEDRDISLIATSTAGEYLRDSDKKNQELLKLLIDTWEQNSKTDLTSVETEVVYSALARASGQEWKDLLSDDNKPNPEILQRVYLLLCSSHN